MFITQGPHSEAQKKRRAPAIKYNDLLLGNATCSIQYYVRIPIFIPTSPDLASILDPDCFLTLRKVHRIGIYALCLRDKEESHDSAHDTAGKEDPEDVGNTNLSWSAQVIEEDA